MNVVDEIKERLDIAAVIGESVKLRKSGKNYTGFCPFHSNTRTPAFVVFPETGTWRCFGACNTGGDVFSFVMKKEDWDFPEALRALAQRAGVELKPLTPEQEAAAEAHERLRDLLEGAVTFYRHHLLQTDAGGSVLAYLKGRGLEESTLEMFEVGFAPDAWEAALTYFLDKGYSEKEMLDAGLVSERETGGFYDRFRNRIMIPIRDRRGRMAGFGARVVDPGDVPKFLNSPQTVIFDKGRLLYGLDRAGRAIRTEDQAVVVEGYMDVMALHQVGYKNAVSPMGTALTEAQLRMLKRYSRRIILALDADVAGDRATLRGLTLARQALGREPDPVFDARGLIRYEGRLDAEIRIITLPEGTDPDEVVHQDAQAWPQLLSNAQTVVDYVMNVLTSGRDLTDAKVKAEVARQVMPLIGDVADPVERQAYQQNLARRLQVDERALLSWKEPGGAARRSAPAAGAGPARLPAPGTLLERFCLGLLLRAPELLYPLDREFQSLEIERLSVRDFSGTERQMIFRAVRAALAQDEMEPEAHWRACLDQTLTDTAQAILEEVGQVDLDRPRVGAEVLAAFLRLRKRNLSQATSQIHFQLTAAEEFKHEAEDDSGPERERLTQRVLEMASEKARLEQALARRLAVPDFLLLNRGAAGQAGSK